jgi:hypothetical protein
MKTENMVVSLGIGAVHSRKDKLFLYQREVGPIGDSNIQPDFQLARFRVVKHDHRHLDLKSWQFWENCYHSIFSCWITMHLLLLIPSHYHRCEVKNSG